MSIWHTKEEKPERFRDIICKLLQHKYRGRIVYRNTGDNVDFYLTGVERWAYPEDFDKIENKLDIAIKGLEEIKSMTFERYLMNNGWLAVRQMRDKAKHALNQIKEIGK